MLSCVILSNQPWMSKGNIFWRLKYLKWFHLTQAERIIIMPFIGNTPKAKSMMETHCHSHGLQFSILKAKGLFSSRPPLWDLMPMSAKTNQELFSCCLVPSPTKKKMQFWPFYEVWCNNSHATHICNNKHSKINKNSFLFVVTFSS